MAYINEIAYNLERRDEVPNQELAKKLADNNCVEGIEEIASYLKDKNKSIASDCLKVLYEIGYIKPELISPYKDQFIELLESKNNRQVWGAMIGISSVAKVNPEAIYAIKDIILDKIKNGSVITNVWGVYTIINLAANGYYLELRDTLFNLQDVCRNVDFPKRAESIIEVLAPTDIPPFIDMLEKRLEHLSGGGQKRVNKLLKKHQ